MIIVSGTIVIDPAFIERATELTTELMAATRAEPGNRCYGFYADIERPGHYQLYEEWDSQEAIDGHNASDHFAAFMAATAELGIVSVEVNQFAVTDQQRIM
jgi:quinol monooxygenase YgiN